MDNDNTYKLIGGRGDNGGKGGKGGAGRASANDSSANPFAGVVDSGNGGNGSLATNALQSMVQVAQVEQEDPAVKVVLRVRAAIQMLSVSTGMTVCLVLLAKTELMVLPVLLDSVL